MRNELAMQRLKTITNYDRNAVDLSVIAPIYNEEDNIPILLERLFEVLDGLQRPFEIIAVNDGSRDRSLEVLSKVAARRHELKIIDFRRNYGQTAAIMAGIDYARGGIVISIDADLQNDAGDIPALLAKMDEGYDVVSGWRKDRKDAPIKRNFVSSIANSIISRVSGVRLKDYGCTLKAYRTEVVRGFRLYGEMHRFIPIYASWMGARVAEIPVQHHSRRFGHSKYGLERIPKVLLDLLVVMFMDRYFVKPIYLFGGVGLLFLLLSFLIGLSLIGMKLVGVSMILTPLPQLAAMLFLFGGMNILVGVLAEISVRTYFESQGRAAYHERRFINFDD